MPTLACEDCRAGESLAGPGAEPHIAARFTFRSGRLVVLPFKKIATLVREDLVRLLSLKGREHNALRDPKWQRTLWRIWYRSQRRNSDAGLQYPALPSRLDVHFGV
jgi:hypothetical protein